MQPNQPNPPQSSNQNPYDFITNPGKPTRKPTLGGNSFMGRIIIVLGGAVILIILMVIIVSLLGSGGQSNTATLKSLVAEQEEVVRVAELGSTKAQDSSVRATAITAKLSTRTQQQAVIAHLEKQGVEVSKEELAAKKNSRTDSELESAATNNRFDDTFQATLTELLNNYAQSLQDAYNATSNEETKQVLSDSYSSTATLLGFK